MPTALFHLPKRMPRSRCIAKAGHAACIHVASGYMIRLAAGLLDLRLPPYSLRTRTSTKLAAETRPMDSLLLNSVRVLMPPSPVTICEKAAASSTDADLNRGGKL